MLKLEEETGKIINACMEVHNELGSGFLEPVYQEALEKEFKLQNIPYEREKLLPITYKGVKLEKEYYADFICYDKIIVELKYSDNSKIISGLSKQLPQYMASEEAGIGHYVVLDVGKMGNKMKNLEKVRNEMTMKCHIHYIDANIKPSASKL